ncbi:DUF7312 domain-containing protein [Haloarchaeobius salinus]|uniref:DUF7312 domain-containing protein n=1 Tax=Haloarchaeobius salinus TaxID=1198298 RepID=UPI0021089DB7|nr:hypothetical protein [Haloarchaeobius salinus]
MEDESTRPGREDESGTSHPGGSTTADDTADGPAEADDEFEWVDDGDWDPPNVERRASDDAEAVPVGYVDMDEVIEPGDVTLENAMFVAIGVLGTIGLLLYIVQLAG